MQLRCTYCQMMFALSRGEMLSALEHLDEHKLQYYDAHCPKCRRANRVERFKLERAFPNWKGTLRDMAKEATLSNQGQTSPNKAAMESKKVPAVVRTTSTKPAALKATSPASKISTIKKTATIARSAKTVSRSAPKKSSTAKLAAKTVPKRAAKQPAVSKNPLKSAGNKPDRATSSPKGKKLANVKKAATRAKKK